MRRNKNNKKLLFFTYMILYVLYFQTIVYSAFSSTMNITGVAHSRVAADVRITDFRIDSINDATSSYEEFGKDHVVSNIILPNSNSYVMYEIEVTNYGNNVGISDITGLSSDLEYELIGYELKDKLCDSDNKCNLGSVSTFKLKIKWKNYDSNSIVHDLKLNFDFKNAYSITYSGISGDYPTTVMEGDALTLSFEDNPLFNIVVYKDNVKYDNYTYVNAILTVNSINSDLTIKYVEKVTVNSLHQDTDFYGTEYYDKVKEVFYVNYIDIPDDALVNLDLSKNNDMSIIGWINTDYTMYVGSDWKIVQDTHQYAFSDMTSLEYVHYDNFNPIDVYLVYAMFKNCSSLKSIDLSHYDFSNVEQFQEMFMNCSNLEYANLAKFNNSISHNGHSIFLNCSKLKSIDLSGYSPPTKTNFFQAFSGCSSLEYLNISNIDFSNLSGYYNMFNNIPNDAQIIVKDQEQKNWALNQNSALTNIIIAN